ncbi:TPA: haloacid dehalogenase-like hydrolase [Streptococcus suis]|nr:haloacid dehalogenase-like hydrolase [Streptococcus suis]
MTRLISANPSEIIKMSAKELKQSILESEGRVVLSENVAFREAFVDDLTNAEIARAFGADLILLNGVDVFSPFVSGMGSVSDTFVTELRSLVACPIGVNLEPVDASYVKEEKDCLVKGRQATVESLQRAEELGFDFICLTGNPGSGVSNQTIRAILREARTIFSGLIIAGKMHGAGIGETLMTPDLAEEFLTAGADIILIPAVGTVPSLTEEEMRLVVNRVHQQGGLAMSAIGTSQESSDSDTIKTIALQNKMCGVDIQHIGDAGYGGLAPVENIYALSKAIRGIRHTVSRMARSIKR